MSASLRDVRVVSPAVNLPGQQVTAVLDATREAPKPAGPGVPLIAHGLQASRGTVSAAVIGLQ